MRRHLPGAGGRDRRRRLLGAADALLIISLPALLVVSSCHKDPPVTPRTRRGAQPQVSVDGAGQPDAAMPFDGAIGGAPDASTAMAGDWIETGLYRLKVGELRGCDVPAAVDAGDASGSSDEARRATDAGAAHAKPSPRSRWVGFFVEIEARRDESFISPRDTTLHRGGIILDAKFHKHPHFPRCMPLLPQKLLRKGQSLRGYLLYEIPASFLDARGPITLEYRPTRWGGAPRVQIKIPDCLDSCSATTFHPGWRRF